MKITFQPWGPGSGYVEVDRLRDGRYRASHSTGFGSIELCRSDDIEILLRMMNAATATAAARGPAMAVRDLRDVALPDKPCAGCGNKGRDAPCVGGRIGTDPANPSESDPSIRDHFFTFHPLGGAGAKIEVDRMPDGRFRASHRSAMGIIEIFRTDDLDYLLREVAKLMSIATPSGYVAAVLNMRNLAPA